MTKKTYKVNGMTCSGCVRTVQTILQNQPGVNRAEVSLEPSEASVEFDENTTSFEAFSETVAKMGYKLVEE
jgi:copper chaperone